MSILVRILGLYLFNSFTKPLYSNENFKLFEPSLLFYVVHVNLLFHYCFDIQGEFRIVFTLLLKHSVQVKFCKLYNTVLLQHTLSLFNRWSVGIWEPGVRCFRVCSCPDWHVQISDDSEEFCQRHSLLCHTLHADDRWSGLEKKSFLHYNVARLSGHICEGSSL